MKWWIYVDGTVSDCPYHREQLQGREDFTPDTPVCRTGSGRWRSASEDPELAVLFEGDNSEGLTVPPGLDEVDFTPGRAAGHETRSSDSDSESSESPSWRQRIDWWYVGGFLLVILVGGVAAVNLPKTTISEDPSRESKHSSAGDDGSRQSPGVEPTTDYEVSPLFDEQYRQRLPELIDSADTRIIVAMYLIESNALLAGRSYARHDDWVIQLMEKLAEARERDVSVSVMLSQPKPKQDPKRTKANRLSKAWLEERDIAVTYNRSVIEMHDKVILIDNRWVIQGSHNWTPTGVGENREVSLLLKATDGHQWTWDRYWKTLKSERTLRR